MIVIPRQSIISLWTCIVLAFILLNPADANSTSHAIATITTRPMAATTKAIDMALESGLETCDDLYQIPTTDQCTFVISHCQDHTLGFIDYFKLYYCHASWLIPHSIFILWTCVLLVIFFISLGITSSEFLCPNLSTFAKVLNIPDNLSGLTLLAFGNGSPDILGTYASFKTDNGSLAIGELIGSAFLITTLVIGTMSLVHPFKIFNSETTLTEDKLVFIRDLAFFIFSVVCVMICLVDGNLTQLECLVLSLLYLLYVCVIISWNWILRRMSRSDELERRARGLYDFESDDTHWTNNADLLLFEQQDDKLQNVSTLMRHSLLNALEFETLIQDLRSKQSFPSGSTASAAVRLPINDDNDEEAPGGMIDDYEARNSAIENEIEMEMDDLDRQDSTTIMMIWYQVTLIFQDFKTKTMGTKVFTILGSPVFLLLKLTTPVRVLEDFDAVQRQDDAALLMLQTFLSPILIMFTISSANFFVNLISALVLGGVLATCVYLIFGTSAKGTQGNTTTNVFGNYVGAAFGTTSAQRAKAPANLMLCVLGFITSICWISLIANELISILKFLSNVFQLSDAILGLTLFAMGNSVGDFISNFTIAKMGYPLMALAACFGGPLLNLLLGIGLNGVIVMNESNDRINIELDSTLIISSVCLLLNLLFLIIMIPYNNWTFDRRIGIIMISFWCIGTVLNILLSAV